MNSMADKKAAKREKMMNMPSYRLMVGAAKYMDKWFLDPILGFIFPVGIGDALTSVFAFPFIYYSLCVVKSIPLTLAVIYNILKDVLIGAIPFYIGDVLDVFKRSYVENLRLVTGYIEDDKEIINKVNKKAFWTAVFIVVLCWLIYVVISWAISLGTMAYDWIVSLFESRRKNCARISSTRLRKSCKYLFLETYRDLLIYSSIFCSCRKLAR